MVVNFPEEVTKIPAPEEWVSDHLEQHILVNTLLHKIQKVFISYKVWYETFVKSATKNFQELWSVVTKMSKSVKQIESKLWSINKRLKKAEDTEVVLPYKKDFKFIVQWIPWDRKTMIVIPDMKKVLNEKYNYMIQVFFMKDDWTYNIKSYNPWDWNQFIVSKEVRESVEAEVVHWYVLCTPIQ